MSALRSWIGVRTTLPTRSSELRPRRAESGRLLRASGDRGAVAPARATPGLVRAKLRASRFAGARPLDESPGLGANTPLLLERSPPDTFTRMLHRGLQALKVGRDRVYPADQERDSSGA